MSRMNFPPVPVTVTQRKSGMGGGFGMKRETSTGNSFIAARIVERDNTGKAVSAQTADVLWMEAMRMALIDREALIADFMNASLYPAFVRRRIENAPSVDFVPAEKYDELRELFVDYVCSGITNPAPYCKNRCAECLDGYGWCRHSGENCAGFDPDKEG